MTLPRCFLARGDVFGASQHFLRAEVLLAPVPWTSMMCRLQHYNPSCVALIFLVFAKMLMLAALFMYCQ